MLCIFVSFTYCDFSQIRAEHVTDRDAIHHICMCTREVCEPAQGRHTTERPQERSKETVERTQ